jgi:hypothetical protein
MLKGSLKTKIVVKTISTTCKVKVDKVKNLMEEDAFGNPAYKAILEISLDGSDLERNIKVKYKRDVVVMNLHGEGASSQVKDLHYIAQTPADNVTVFIDPEGRFKSVTFPFENQQVTCKF